MFRIDATGQSSYYEWRPLIKKSEHIFQSFVGFLLLIFCGWSFIALLPATDYTQDVTTRYNYLFRFVYDNLWAICILVVLGWISCASYFYEALINLIISWRNFIYHLRYNDLKDPYRKIHWESTEF